MVKKKKSKPNILSFMRRVTALVLVVSFLVPSRAYAVGTLIELGKTLIGGEEEQQEQTPKSDYSDQFASEAEKLKKRLNSGSADEKKRLRLSQAKTLAIAMNEKIEAVDMRIDAKTAKMQSSIRSLRERERSMSTIRWSPILNFKFPEDPKEVEAFEFQFKPTQLQNEITSLKHKITELQMDTNEKVSNTYVQIIHARDEVDRLTARHKKLETTVAKLEVKLKDGTAAANSTDVVTETDAEGNEVVISPRILKARVKAAEEKLEAAQGRLDNCTTELTNAKTELEEKKKKLGDMLGFTITDRFTFDDAFVTANLNRDNIEYLYTYALDDDPDVYAARMAHDEALLALRINYDLMKKHYSGYISVLEPYVQQALDGTKIPKKAFKKDYDQFLKDIDEPWQGSYKIWFIKIPKEWLKGDTDGIRYVEDDPYVLYSAILDYEAAKKEYDNAQMDLYNSIYDAYSNYASTRKAYLTANNAYVKADKLLGLSEVNYLLGEMTLEEFEEEEQECNALKDDAADALTDFSETLYSFDRTTCGALSKFFEGAEANRNTEALMLTPIIRTGCMYTFRPIIDSEEFLLSIDVPDDFYAETGINITHFQLFADGNQIKPVGYGEAEDETETSPKTEVGKTLRHMMLSTQSLGECTIRVFDGETFIDECQVDPSVLHGPLNITIGHEEDINAHTLGTYVASDDVATDMLVLTLNLEQDLVQAEYESGNEAAYYRLCVAQDTYVLSDDMVPVDRQFTYLKFLKSDLEDIYIELFDSDMEKIGDAWFDTTNNELYNKIDEEKAEEIAEKKRKEAEERAAREEEERRLAEIQEQRDAAREVLKKLGMPSDDKSIDYALKHLNELTYDIELLNAISSLEAEHEQDEKKYAEMLEDPKTKASDLAAMEDRLRITGEMPKVYEATLGEGVLKYKEELENYRRAKLAELLAQYISLYNKKVSAEDEGTDTSDLDAQMDEIEAQVVDEFDSNVIAEFKELVVPFEDALKRLYAYQASDFATSEKFSDVKSDIDTAKESVTKLEGSEFARLYTYRRYRYEEAAASIASIFNPRLGKAIYHVIKEIGTEIDELNTNFELTVYTIRKSDYEYVDYILAMDDSNVDDIQAIIGPDTEHKIHRLPDFTDNPRNIKDPWYTGNFEECYDDIVEGCKAFLNYLKL